MSALPLLHADERLIVVNKPSGLLSVPGRGPDKQDCASARVQQQFADALIVHRLDQATSGLLLLARGAAAQRDLSQAFATRRVDKRYVAVVTGTLAQDELEIDLPLLADWPNRPRQRVDHALGKRSQTLLRVLERGPDYTRVELSPLTGRTHQLRVHLMAIGHAILGDTLYAGPVDAERAPRLLLHASELLLQDSGQRFYCAPDF